MEFRETESLPTSLDRRPLQSQKHYVDYRNHGFGYNQGMGRANNFQLGIGQASGSFQSMTNVSAHPEILRELEKQRIREEIISGDIVRRRVLEEEVRAELMREKELRLRMKEGNAYDRYLVKGESGGLATDVRGISYAQEANKGISFDEIFGMRSEEWLKMQERISSLEERFDMRSEEGLKPQERSEMQRFEIVPFQQRSTEFMVQEASSGREAVKPWGVSLLQEGKKRLSLEERIAANSEEGLKTQARCETQALDWEPFQRRSVGSPSVTENGKQKERIVFLAKPSSDLSGTKRKLESACEGKVCETSGVGNKRGKKTWTCDVCQVYATSEVGLNDHLRGKKHKAMEDAVNGKIIGVGFLPKTIAEPIPSETGNVPGRKERMRKFTTDRKIKDKSKFSFWCEMCQVGAYSETVMEAHRIGKMHSMMLSLKS